MAPAPYYEFRQILHSANSAPLGTNASSNYERYSNPAVDKALDDFGQADTATQHELLKQVQAGDAARRAGHPHHRDASSGTSTTPSAFTGWPTEEDPYALPAPWQIPDDEQVLLHLAPRSDRGVITARRVSPRGTTRKVRS